MASWLLALVGRVRSELKQSGVTATGDDWQRALDINMLLALIREGKNDEAKQRLVESLRASNQQLAVRVEQLDDEVPPPFHFPSFPSFATAFTCTPHSVRPFWSGPSTSSK